MFAAPTRDTPIMTRMKRAEEKFLHATAGVEQWLDSKDDHPERVLQRAREQGTDIIDAIAESRVLRMRFINAKGELWDPRKQTFASFHARQAWEEPTPILSPEEVRAWLA